MTGTGDDKPCVACHLIKSPVRLEYVKHWELADRGAQIYLDG